MARRKHYITKSSEKARAEAFTNGRGRNQAFTSGARTAQTMQRNGNNISEEQGMRDAWSNRSNVPTYTSTRSGRMSTNGRTAGGSTWTFTRKGTDGQTLNQSGRNKLASRRQRYYDVRLGLGLAGG